MYSKISFKMKMYQLQDKSWINYDLCKNESLQTTHLIFFLNIDEI